MIGMDSKVFKAKFALLMLVAATGPGQGTMTDMQSSAADVGTCSGDPTLCGANSFGEDFDEGNLLQVKSSTTIGRSTSTATMNMSSQSGKLCLFEGAGGEGCAGHVKGDLKGKVDGKEAEAEAEAEAETYAAEDETLNVIEVDFQVLLSADREANMLKVMGMKFLNDGHKVEVVDPNGVEHVHAGSVLEKVTSNTDQAVQLTGDRLVTIPTSFTGKELLEADAEILTFKALPAPGMCPEGHYVEVIDHKPGDCKPCAAHCKTCFGPTMRDCQACVEPWAVFMFRQDGQPRIQRKCVSECPECYPKSKRGVCSKDRACLASKKITQEETMASVAKQEEKNERETTEAPSKHKAEEEETTEAETTKAPSKHKAEEEETTEEEKTEAPSKHKAGAPGSGMSMWPFLLSACLGIAVAFP